MTADSMLSLAEMIDRTYAFRERTRRNKAERCDRRAAQLGNKAAAECSVQVELR